MMYPRRPISQWRAPRAFTLVEILTVISIILVIATLITPAVNSIYGGRSFGSSANEISNILAQARSYAMAHNTYVYLGLEEVDASTPDTAPTQTKGTGRIVIAVVATRDGARGISPANITLASGNLVAISKVRTFANLHFGTPNPDGNMARPAVAAEGQVGNEQAFDCDAAVFAWPFSGTSKYQFKKVIEFDPQGVPRPAKGGEDAIASRLEIGLLQSHGTNAPTASTASVQQAAIQLDGMTGYTRIYRP